MSAEDYYYCPITRELMRNPMIDKEGNTFECDAIVEWLITNGCSPITQTPITVEDLFLNRSLQKAIEVFRQSQKPEEQTAKPESRQAAARETVWGAGEAIAKGAMGVFMSVKVKVCEVRRQVVMQSFQKGLEQGWGPQQVAMISRPFPKISKGVVRIVAVRHGFGKHNEGMGIGSMANRDADLVPSIGVPQAYATGRKLAAAGLFNSPISDSLLIVISPFRRTLQTALNLLAADKWCHPTLITPLAAEHTFERSGVMQGDRGSTAAQLREWFPEDIHPQFNFALVDKYCADKGVADGAWWHHGAGKHETESSFESRTRHLRRFLYDQGSAMGARTILLVSHGGLLTHTFDKEKYDNCEFRCYDLFEDGTFDFPGGEEGEEVAENAGRTSSVDKTGGLGDAASSSTAAGTASVAVPTQPSGEIDLLNLMSEPSPSAPGVPVVQAQQRHTADVTGAVVTVVAVPPSKPPKPPKPVSMKPTGQVKVVEKPTVFTVIIDEVVQEVRQDGGHCYHIVGKLGNGLTIDQRYRLSTLRERLKDVIKAQVPRALSDSLGEFPSTFCPHTQVMRYLEPWLLKMCEVVNSVHQELAAEHAFVEPDHSGVSTRRPSAGAVTGTTTAAAGASQRQSSSFEKDLLGVIVVDFFTTPV